MERLNHDHQPLMAVNTIPKVISSAICVQLLPCGIPPTKFLLGNSIRSLLGAKSCYQNPRRSNTSVPQNYSAVPARPALSGISKSSAATTRTSTDCRSWQGHPQTVLNLPSTRELVVLSSTCTPNTYTQVCGAAQGGPAPAHFRGGLWGSRTVWGWRGVGRR